MGIQINGTEHKIKKINDSGIVKVLDKLFLGGKEIIANGPDIEDVGSSIKANGNYSKDKYSLPLKINVTSSYTIYVVPDDYVEITKNGDYTEDDIKYLARLKNIDYSNLKGVVVNIPDPNVTENKVYTIIKNGYYSKTDLSSGGETHLTINIKDFTPNEVTPKPDKYT